MWAEIGSDEALVKSMEAGKAFQDLENFFGKADKPKVDKEKKESKKKGPQMVNLLGKRHIHTHTYIQESNIFRYRCNRYIIQDIWRKGMIPCCLLI